MQRDFHVNVTAHCAGVNMAALLTFPIPLAK